MDFLLGATLVQYPAWVAGTVLGCIGSAPAIGDPKALGLDAIFPAFFLGLLASELPKPEAKIAARSGAAIALLLTPIAPAGVPIIAASLAPWSGCGDDSAIWITVVAWRLRPL